MVSDHSNILCAAAVSGKLSPVSAWKQLKRLEVLEGLHTGVPDASSMADSPNAVPTHSVCTGGFMYFMVS